jgi:DNA-binding transcriptional ArsR family regulator
MREHSTDALFEALADPHRRRILLELADGGPDAELSPEGLRARFWRDDSGVGIELRHVDLPKLAELGFVDWDSETGTIARGRAFPVARACVRSLDEHDDELPIDWP